MEKGSQGREIKHENGLDTWFCGIIESGYLSLSVVFPLTSLPKCSQKGVLLFYLLYHMLLSEMAEKSLKLKQQKSLISGQTLTFHSES